MRALTFALVTFAFTALPSSSRAEMVRFRYVPVDPCGRAGLIPIGPEGSAGELFRGLGMRAQPYAQPPRPTHWVTFRQPNGKNLIVPLTLPQGTPRMETRSDKIVYHYDAYDVEVRFFADGTVDVCYNSGWLRPLTF